MNVLQNKIEVNLSSENFVLVYLNYNRLQIHDIEDEFFGNHPRLVALEF